MVIAMEFDVADIDVITSDSAQSVSVFASLIVGGPESETVAGIVERISQRIVGRTGRTATRHLGQVHVAMDVGAACSEAAKL